MNYKITFIFELVSTIIMIIAYILLIIQSFDNYNFKEYKDKDSIIERFLYEQFSLEVYDNLEQKISSINQDNYYPNRGNKKIDIYLETFYDCRGVKDFELNEKICQDKILENNTCCRAECCSRTNGGKINCLSYKFEIEFNKDDFHDSRFLYYNYDEYLEDPKRRLCKYFSKYKRYVSLYNFVGTFYVSEYNYAEILLDDSNKFCIGKRSFCKKKFSNINDCGIIDTKNNHLYLNKTDECPINQVKETDSEIYTLSSDANKSKKIIINHILSENPPNIFELKGYYVNSKTEEKMSNIYITDINDFIKEKNNNYFEKQDVNFVLSNLNKVLSYGSGLNTKQKLNWYTTNYIGFETKKDLEIFVKYFKKDSDKNNPLYRIGEELFPSLESIIIGFIITFLSILYIVFLSLFLKNFFENFQKKLAYFMSLRQFIFFAAFGLETGVYIRITQDFEEIDIDMDDNYKNILDLYNDRRQQLYLLLSIIFLCLSELVTIISWYFSFNNRKNNNDIILLPQENNNNEINNNQNKINNEANNINNQNEINNEDNNDELRINSNNQNDKEDSKEEIKYNLKTSENRNLLIKNPIENKNKYNKTSTNENRQILLLKENKKNN